MSEPLIGITVALTVLAILLLNVNLRTPWPWPVKAASVVVTFVTVVAVYFAVQGLLGWPVESAALQNLRVLAVDIVEPDKTQSTSGAIYVWAKAEDPQQPPRAYAFSYSKSLHQAAAQAQERLRNGRRQGARVTAPSEAGDGGRAPPVTFYDWAQKLRSKPARALSAD